MDHVCAVLRIPYRILRNICLHIAQLQIIACIQHTTVGIAASLDQVILGFLSGSHEHLRAFEMFRKQRLGNLRTEVAQIYTERITAVLPDILQGIHHVNLALNDADRTLVDIRPIILRLISFHQGFSSVHCKRCRKTVTAYSHNTNFYFR